jgi:hypothetical protein
LLVAAMVSRSCQCLMRASRTIAHLDLDRRIALRDILRHQLVRVARRRAPRPRTFTLLTTLDMVAAGGERTQYARLVRERWWRRCRVVGPVETMRRRKLRYAS